MTRIFNDASFNLTDLSTTSPVAQWWHDLEDAWETEQDSWDDEDWMTDIRYDIELHNNATLYA